MRKLDIFVNRTDELDKLSDWVRGGSNVLLLGLRGYGKTSLLIKLVENLKNELIGVYFNCLAIYDGRDLLIWLRRELERYRSRGFSDSELSLIDAKMAHLKHLNEYLDALYELADRFGVRLIIFDEISSLFRKFGVQKPYRMSGGSLAVAEHFKALLDSYMNISTIFSDTSINFQYEAFKDYSAPLLRQYEAELDLGPLSYRDTLVLVRELLRRRKITLSDEVVNFLVEVSGGVPIYVNMLLALVKDNISVDELNDAIEESMSSGLLNDYFQALLDKFSWNEQETLFAISRGRRRFGEIQHDVAGAAQSLESLQKKRIVIKIRKNRREVYYSIRDKLFETWLAMSEIPRYRKISFKRAKVLSFGFEALVRELFFTLREEVDVIDTLNQKLHIYPPNKVTRYEGALGEIDMIAHYSDGVVIGEIYFGEACRREKIDQLVRSIGIAEKLGYKVKYGLVISYFGFRKDALERAKELINEGVKLYLIGERELREIAKKSMTRIP